MENADWYEPAPKNPRFVPCICGYNRRQIIHDYWYSEGFFVGSGRFFYVCNRCKLMGYFGKNKNDAKLKWNQMIDDIEAGTKEPEYYRR